MFNIAVIPDATRKSPYCLMTVTIKANKNKTVRGTPCFKILAFDSLDTFFGHPHLSTVIIFTVDMTNINNIINKHN